MLRSPDSPTPVELTDAKATPDVIEVPSRSFIAISGEGAPESADFAASIGALYGIAYGLKFSRKKTGGNDFKVGALVGVWRAEARAHPAGQQPPRDAWRWTLQLDMPPDVTDKDVQDTVSAAVAKKGGKLEGSPYVRRVTLVRQKARRYGRILHVGPYSDEPASFATIESLLESQGLKREPWHVEVYLSDPGRVAPEKLKTVLLAPVIA
jgi:hypothetical protein